MVEYRNPFEKQGTPASRLRDKLASDSSNYEKSTSVKDINIPLYLLDNKDLSSLRKNIFG